MKVSQKSGKVFYALRPSKDGRPPFSDVNLPGGLVIRRVDEAVHKLALSNARKMLKKAEPR